MTTFNSSANNNPNTALTTDVGLQQANLQKAPKTGQGGSSFNSILQSSGSFSSKNGLDVGMRTIMVAAGQAGAANPNAALGAGSQGLSGLTGGGTTPVGFGSGTTSTGMGGLGGLTGGGVGGAGGNSSMGTAQGLVEQQQNFNLQFLFLQSSMQQENQKFSTLSNVMKTRHDTVKNSISNIR